MTDESENLAETAKPRGPEIDLREVPLPTWTERYPEEERGFLAAWGADPGSNQAAHDHNLRIIEVGHVFDRVARNPQRHELDLQFLRHVFPGCIAAASEAVRQKWNDYFVLKCRHVRFDQKGPPIPPPPEVLEVSPDWLSMYPPEHARLLEEYGVPTVPGTLVDDYNRRLIELVPLDSADLYLLFRATRSALYYAFGEHFFDPRLPPPDELEFMLERHEADNQPELEDVVWSYYPEECRQLLSSLGRPDYEHPNAAVYNRALIAGKMFLQETSDDGCDALKRLRSYLWPALFVDAPCP